MRPRVKVVRAGVVTARQVPLDQQDLQDRRDRQGQKVPQVLQALPGLPGAAAEEGDGGWPSAADFPGGDLGAKLNAAFAAGHLAVDVPPAQWTISTPVNLPMGACVRIDWHSYPHHIVCATRGKPVFECVGGKRHWRILGGCFYGSGSGTPSCFLLCGRDDATGQQCGDIGLLSAVQTSGSWGIAGIVNIAGEILNFQDCNFWMQGRGDMNWGGATRHRHHCER